MDMGVGTLAFADSENLLRGHVLETYSATYLLDVRRNLYSSLCAFELTFNDGLLLGLLHRLSYSQMYYLICVLCEELRKQQNIIDYSWILVKVEIKQKIIQQKQHLMGEKSKKKHIKKEKKGQSEGQKRVRTRPKTRQQFYESIKTASSDIKNKQKRIQVNMQRRSILNQIKMKQRKERKKLPASQRQKPITIEDKQQGGQEFLDEYDEAQLDEFQKYLDQQAPIKILLTTSIKPPKKIYDYLRELMMVFHNIYYYPRETMKLQQVYTYAKNLNYTHVMVVRYNNRGYQLLVRHLQGMLAVFKVTSLQFQKQIKHHAVATEHIPELILNNFDSKIGVKVGRLLASLFPQNPEFKGRRVVTFHNQRDFIFFRHHRYIFTEGYEGVNMQEIGPRFTLQVKKVFAGTQQKVAGLQFEAKDNMYVQRKAVYL